MCTTCGCSETQDVRYTMPGAHTHGPDGHSHDHDHAHPHDHSHAHPHDHGHDHKHAPTADPRAALHAGVHGRSIALEQDILAKNQVLAERNRGWFEGREVLAVNLMSSPGSGKTTLLERTIRELSDDVSIYVVEGDQATTHDAERIRATGCPVIQVNTGTGCHLEADMLARGLKQLSNTFVLRAAWTECLLVPAARCGRPLPSAGASNPGSKTRSEFGTMPRTSKVPVAGSSAGATYSIVPW